MIEIRLVDLLMILAVLLGPIIAVRITRWLDDRNERRARKLAIFRTLMATRAAGVSHSHVEALNSIDIEFSSRKKNDEGVRLAWKSYLDLLSDNNMPRDQWYVRRIDVFVDLLSVMGRNLGYDFDKVHIKNGVYSPTAHGELEADQTTIRHGFRELLEGKRAIPIVLTNLPPGEPPKAIE